MKKLFSFLLAAMMLPMMLGAQQLAPAQVDLGPNQMLLGHYTTDDIALGGCWGRSFLSGTLPIATDLTSEELARFQGSKIVAFRVGLSESTPVSRVFVIPINANGNLGEATEWPCQASDEGWNIIELDEPYLINLPADYKLRIGFDYEQTRTNKPISAVNVGTIYPSFIYRNGSWGNYGVNTIGNLSLQCICENDNFPAYVIKTRNLTSKNSVKIGDELSFSFQVCNLGIGEIPAGNCVMEVAIDGNVVGTITNPEMLTDNYITVSGTVPTTGIATGEHTLTVTPVSVNGEPIENPIVASCIFKAFEFGFTRQMRLVEQFTSTECTWCPTGSRALQALCDMRGDIAWVGVHQILSSYDPFRNLQADSIADYEHCTGYPEGSFDRAAGIEEAGEVCGVLSYTSATGGAQVFNAFLESIDDTPAWATININSTYNPETRKAEITISGELVPNFDEMMGAGSKLTVYITEDNLVAAQIDGSATINDYVHNGVFRTALGGVRGVNINKDGETYNNQFTVNIPSTWNPDNLSIVAFISRPLGGPLTDLRVNQTNKRKLGEFDEPTMLGDIDGNGAVNISDVTELVTIVLNDAFDGVDMDAADINRDGTLSITDVVDLITLVLNS